MAPNARLGRPPDTDSAETRAAIVRSARALFGSRGYEATSNRAIAEAAGVTTGALYHYFDSKLAIYVAVFADTEAIVLGRMGEAAEVTTTFVDRLRATLETAYELNVEDPSLARFLGACRVDTGRDPALRDSLRGRSMMMPFFRDLIDLGVASGEIAAGQRDVARDVLDTIIVGLVQAVSDDHVRHRNAIDGLLALVDGKLIQP